MHPTIFILVELSLSSFCTTFYLKFYLTMFTFVVLMWQNDKKSLRDMKFYLDFTIQGSYSDWCSVKLS